MKKITLGVDTKGIDTKYEAIANMTKQQFTELMKILKDKNNG
jgi:hypothetical protein